MLFRSDLVEHFNEMSKRIKLSREGLDTHNLYLETILKYTYGVIALNQDKIIQLINPVIGKMLQIGDESAFLGQSYDSIIENYENRNGSENSWSTGTHSD